MKQLLSLLSLLIIAFNLNAQIDVIKYEVEEIANISNCGRLSRGGDRLVLYKGYYALCLYTSNQFDEPIIVRMGDLEEALMTFKDIQDKWYTMNRGDYFIIGDTRFMMMDENKSTKVLHITDKTSAGFSTLYLKSIQACYMVLHNISINMSRLDSTKVTTQIDPIKIQPGSNNSSTTSNNGAEQSTESNDKSVTSIADELLKLNQLKEMGVLTEEEFKTLKARIISK